MDLIFIKYFYVIFEFFDDMFEVFDVIINFKYTKSLFLINTLR